MIESKPTLQAFNPRVIPYQYQVLKDLRANYDYNLGVHEVLLSGSVGSAKSILMAHIAVTHCLFFKGARLLLGRRALPDLKATIYQKILEHLRDGLTEGRDYNAIDTIAKIEFANGSEIISRSWADTHYEKFRSLEISAACIEETAENDTIDFYNELKMRVGRLPNVPEKFIIHATNPADPGHWAYKYFMETPSPTRHVYYSVTTDNPFLPASYINQLRADLSPLLARRMIFGEWISIAQEVIYYAYDKGENYRDTAHRPELAHPIHISWDFNIGEGKPLSLVVFSYHPVEDTFHIWDEVIVEGMRTEDSCEELAGKGILDMPAHFIINGDATGKHRDTRNIKSDYDIIKNYFANYRTKDGRPLSFEIDVPLANPPIRNRHNLLNAYCLNDLGRRRLFVYKNCPIVDKGLRLTQLKKDGQYIEDDSQSFQHVTTALGYGIISTLKATKKPITGTRRF